MPWVLCFRIVCSSFVTNKVFPFPVLVMLWNGYWCLRANHLGALLTSVVQWMSLLWSICMAPLDHQGISFIVATFGTTIVQNCIEFAMNIDYVVSPELNRLMNILLLKPYFMLIGIRGQQTQLWSTFIYNLNLVLDPHSWRIVFTYS